MTTEKNIAILCNALAGVGKAILLAEKIEGAVSQKQISFTVFKEKWPEDFDGFTDIWIVGGDGTLNYYINHYSERFGKHHLTMTPQTVDMLMVSNWEGNVRQLCNEIQRVVARAEDNEVITPEHLSPELKRNAKPLTPFDIDSNVKPIASYDGSISPFTNITAGGTLESAVSELEMQLIKSALSRHNWNISRVANELGLTRRGLYLKLSRYGIAKAA